jgi:hypothetical protein
VAELQRYYICTIRDDRTEGLHQIGSSPSHSDPTESEKAEKLEREGSRRDSDLDPSFDQRLQVGAKVSSYDDEPHLGMGGANQLGPRPLHPATISNGVSDQGDRRGAE